MGALYLPVLETFKQHLMDQITLPKQVDYLAKVADLVDLVTAPLILMEPGAYRPESKSTVWRGRPFNVRLWIMVPITTDYLEALGQVQELLGAADEEAQRIGIEAALARLRENEAYVNLQGTFGGKRWRVNAGSTEWGGPTFGTYKLASGPMATATLDVQLNIEKER